MGRSPNGETGPGSSGGCGTTRATASVLAAAETYLLITRVTGWDLDAYQDWLATTWPAWAPPGQGGGREFLTALDMGPKPVLTWGYGTEKPLLTAAYGQYLVTQITKRDSPETFP
jgi:hypothetical protein